MLQPLEDVIRSHLIPSLTNGRWVTDDERQLLSLSPRLGGMGIISAVMIRNMSSPNLQLSHWRMLSSTNNIFCLLVILKLAKMLGWTSGPIEGSCNLIRLKTRSRMTIDQKWANENCCEVGASNWLTALPIEDKGFALNKRESWELYAYAMIGQSRDYPPCARVERHLIFLMPSHAKKVALSHNDITNFVTWHRTCWQKFPTMLASNPS